MTILRQTETEAKQTKWISPAGRLIALDFSARRDAVPAWLVDKLLAHAKRFDWGDECTDAWEILQRVNSQIVWRGAWGTMSLPSGLEIFISNQIEWPRHADVDAAAEAVNASYAFAPDGRFAWAERAAIWRER